MTSIPRPRLSNSGQTSAPLESNSVGKSICFVVGLTCIAGFIVDLSVLSTPPDPLALEWRMNFLQQVSDRSIVFFFGVALLLYGVFDNYRIRKPLSFACLVVGVAILLSSMLVIRDSLVLKEQTIRNITAQEEQIQIQIEESQSNSELLPDVSPAQLQQAAQELTSRAQVAKQNTTQTINKSGFASIGNLLVVGFGMVSLSRVGMKRRR